MYGVADLQSDSLVGQVELNLARHDVEPFLAAMCRGRRPIAAWKLELDDRDGGIGTAEYRVESFLPLMFHRSPGPDQVILLVVRPFDKVAQRNPVRLGNLKQTGDGGLPRSALQTGQVCRGNAGLISELSERDMAVAPKFSQTAANPAVDVGAIFHAPHTTDLIGKLSCLSGGEVRSWAV